MASEAEQEQEIGLDISWRHTKNLRQITVRFGAATVRISHTKDEQGARDLTLLVQCLPAALEQIAAAIFAKESPDGIEG